MTLFKVLDGDLFQFLSHCSLSQVSPAWSIGEAHGKNEKSTSFHTRNAPTSSDIT